MTEVDLVISSFARELAELREEVAALKRANHSEQLGHSSVNLNRSRGYIPFMLDGIEKFRIGRMPDGTITQVSVNNNTPPSVPDLPTATPGLGTIVVGVEKLVGNTPFDFKHVRVYVDGLLDGVITRLPGIWVVSGLDPTQHSIQVSAVNQSGTESAKTAPIYATPENVTERDFDLNPILETEVAPNAITTPKLAANAVEAAKIAADAIRAIHIMAGEVTADKLEAVMVIANRLVAGDPNGRNYSIDSDGMTQFDELGQVLTRFGANAAGGNYLTIVDPEDTQTAVAALDARGVFTCSGFAVTGVTNINGENLTDALNARPFGLVEWANNATNTGTTTTEVGIMELEVQIDPTRHYRIASNTGYLGGTSTVGGSGPQAETRLHFTVNGSRPLISSPILEISARATGFGEPLRIECLFDGAKCPGGRLRLLYSIAALTSGQAIQMITPAGNAEANDLQLWVEDIGPRRTQSGIASNGGGSTAAPVANYTSEWAASWSASYNSSQSSVLYQGDAGYGPGRSLIGFNDTDIRSKLSGATITAVSMYLYANHWWYNGGGTVIAYSHNRTGSGITGHPSNSWPGAGGEIARWNLGKPEGRWVTLPNSFGDALKNNTAKGVALAYGGTDLQFYGKFDNANLAGREPALRISYRK